MLVPGLRPRYGGASRARTIVFGLAPRWSLFIFISGPSERLFVRVCVALAATAEFAFALAFREPLDNRREPQDGGGPAGSRLEALARARATTGRRPYRCEICRALSELWRAGGPCWLAGGRQLSFPRLSSACLRRGCGQFPWRVRAGRPVRRRGPHTTCNDK